MEEREDNPDRNPIGKCAEGREIKPSNENSDAPGFPPWSMKIIALGIVGYLVLNVFSAALVGACTALGDMWFGWGMDLRQQVYVAVVFAEPVYAAQGVAVILLLSRLSPSFLRNAWVSYTFEAKPLACGALLGLMFGGFSAITYEAPAVDAITWSPALVGMSTAQLVAWHLVFGAVMTGIIEEVLFRGVVYQAFRKRFTVGGAVALSALVFTVLHVDQLGNSIQMASSLAAGVTAALLLERTRSLNPSVCFHAMANASGLLAYRFVIDTVA